MIIRPAEPDDALALATILVRSWQHAYRDMLPAEQLAALSIDEEVTGWHRRLAPEHPMRVNVAVIDDVVSGFSGWGIIPDVHPIAAMLYSIYMLPEAMGHGTGTALLRESELGMLAANAETAKLHVLEDNAPTRRFYERAGWQIVPGEERDEHFFGIDVHTVTYHKTLI